MSDLSDCRAKIRSIKMIKNPYLVWPVGVVVTTSLSMALVSSSIPELVQLGTVLLTTRHRCDVSSILYCPDAKPRKRTPPLVTRFDVNP